MLTIYSAVYDAVYNIRASVSAGIPGVLETLKRTAIEGRVGVRYIYSQSLRDREVCLHDTIGVSED